MRTWAVAAALLMAAATAAGSLYVRGYRRGLTDAYVARSVALTESFASVVGSWLAFGYRSSLDVLADILLETEAAGLQFLTQSGPAYERGATGDWAPLDIADWTASARLRGGHLFGASVIEVIAPLAITDEDPPYGCVRIVYSTDPLNDSVRARVGVVAAAWAAFAGCVGLGLRFITHRSEKAGAANRHSLLQVDLASRRVIVRGQSIDLPPKLFGLLACLAEEPGRVHSDAEILRSVWPESAYADSKDVKQCVYMLRHRLGDVLDDPERVIVNVKGYGYRLGVSQV